MPLDSRAPATGERRQLWDALCRRHKGILLVWTQSDNKVGKDRTHVGWQGGYALGMGLAHYALAWMGKTIGDEELTDGELRDG